MTTLAALAGLTSRIRLGLLVSRRDLPAPLGVRGAGHHDRPRVARPARAVARRGLVRQGAHRAGHPVPVDRSSGSTCWRTPWRSCSGSSPARWCPTTARWCRCTTRSCGRRRCSSPTPRSGSAAAARSGRSRWWPATPTCGTRGARPSRWWSRTRRSTSWPPRPAGTRPTILRASVALPRRPRHGPQARRKVARRRLRLPRVRLARRRPRADRALRHRGPARLRVAQSEARWRRWPPAGGSASARRRGAGCRRSGRRAGWSTPRRGAGGTPRRSGREPRRRTSR